MKRTITFEQQDGVEPAMVGRTFEERPGTGGLSDCRSCALFGNPLACAETGGDYCGSKYYVEVKP